MSIHRKEGRSEFGSDGVGLEIETELPDGAFADFATLAAHCNAAFDQAEQLVAERLLKLREAGQPEPARPEPEPMRPYPSAHRLDGRPLTGRPESPRTARELLGWSRRTGRQDELEALGRRMRLPGRILNWTDDEVADVYGAMTAEPARNGQRNGAAY
jgi:hypothetical protein